MSAPVRLFITKREEQLLNTLLALYNDSETEIIKYLGLLAEIAAGRKLLRDLETQHEDARKRPT